MRLISVLALIVAGAVFIFYGAYPLMFMAGGWYQGDKGNLLAVCSLVILSGVLLLVGGVIVYRRGRR